MSKHTPGPWGGLTLLNGNLTIGIDWPEGDERDHFLCEVTSGDPAELEANAKLIAAAPELLEALMQIERMDGTEHWWKYQEIARSAINKATGE